MYCLLDFLIYVYSVKHNSRNRRPVSRWWVVCYFSRWPISVMAFLSFIYGFIVAPIRFGYENSSKMYSIVFMYKQIGDFLRTKLCRYSSGNKWPLQHMCLLLFCTSWLKCGICQIMLDYKQLSPMDCISTTFKPFCLYLHFKRSPKDQTSSTICLLS